MTKEELKKILVDSGNADSSITDADIEKMTGIISQCKSPEEAFKKISESFSGLSEQDLKSNTDVMLSKIQASGKEDVQDLSDEALASVAGGSKAGDWFKNNWGYVVGAVALLGLSVAGAYGLKKMANNRAMSNAQQEGYDAAFGEAKHEGQYVGFTGGLQARQMDDMIPQFQALGLK